MTAIFIDIPGPVGQLETVIQEPVTLSSPLKKCILAIICHPSPRDGGTMNNKVVTTLARTFTEMGVTSLRFNFRGVGQSHGEHGDAIGEIDDTKAVIHWAQKHYPHHIIWLAGFSFGSYIAYNIACNPNYNNIIQHLIMLAPAVNYPYFKNFKQLNPDVTPPCPVLVIIAEQDELVPVVEIHDWIKHSLLTPDILLFKTSHFFHGELMNLRLNIIKTLQPYANSL